jgi:photosystem II stability/assembly factor-like uncharacterized protein
MKNLLSRSLLCLLVIFSMISASAQMLDTPYDKLPGLNINDKPAYHADYPEWAKMLYQFPANYNEVVSAYRAQDKVDNPSLSAVNRYFKLWRKAMEPFALPDGTIVLPDLEEYANDLLRIQQEAGNEQGVNRMASNWSFLGPKETFWLNEAGDPDAPDPCPWQANIYSFDVAASNNDILFCGTETGFVNKTSDQGMTWQLSAPNYYFGGGVTAIAIDPNDANTVYASAGNQIHKTIDGGNTWLPMLSSNDTFGASRLIIDGNNTNVLFAASGDGIHRSTDSGTSWDEVYSQSSYDVVIKADDSQVIYALSTSGGTFTTAISVDGGSSFISMVTFPTGIANDSGGLLAVSADDPNSMLAVLLSADYTPLLYKADLVEDSWELLATGQTAQMPLNNGQGYYDLALEIDPNNADVFFVGTTTLYKTVNGGNSFTAVGGYTGSYAIHPDVQSMKILPSGNMWVGTDGGFTYSTDMYSNTSNYFARNNGLVGSDMWGFDQGWNEDIVVGGRYHNGNTAIADFYQPKALRMGGAESPTGWVLQGKSRHVAFNDLGNGWILPSTAEGEPEGRFIFSKYPNMEEYGGRRSNVLIHPNYYGLIHVGEGNGYWESTDMGVTWDLLYDFGQAVRYIQRSYSNPDVIYADILGSGLQKSVDGGTTWTEMPSLTQAPNGSNYWKGKLFFAISPYDEDVVYACLQNGTWSADIGEVFRSMDGGATWEDWTGGLNEYTKNIVIQPTTDGDDLVYLFTTARNGQAANVYMRGAQDNEWQLFNANYPAGMGVNLALPFYRDSKLRVAGYGGIWESPMEETSFEPIINPWVEKSFYNCMTDTLFFDDHSIMNHDNASWHWEITPQPLYLSDANVRNPEVVLGAPGSYTVDFTVTKDGIEYNKTMVDMVTTTTCPSIDDCSNPAGIPTDIWDLVYVDSEETGDPGLAIMAFDNDPATIWHTTWSSGTDPYPHEIQTHLGEAYTLFSFTYLTRQDGQNGRIKDFELYVSDDVNNWGDAIYVGEFENTSAPQIIEFDTPPQGDYFRLVALSEVNGNPWASAAEFSFVGCNEINPSVQENPFAQLNVFPVPSNGVMTVSLPAAEQFTYRVYSTTGKVVKEGFISENTGQFNLDLTGSTAGIYVLRMQDSTGRIYRVKMVKE